MRSSANFRSALFSNLESDSTPMKSEALAHEVVVVFEFVEISLHVAEVAFDVALHDRLGVDVDTRAVDTGQPLADRCSVHRHPGEIAPRMRQARHAQQCVAQRLADIGTILNGIVERHIA